MKILHIGEYVNGGVATYIKTLIVGSASREIDNYVILSKNKSDNNWPLDKNHIRFYPYYRGVRYILPTILQISDYIKEIRPDIIYCHSTWAGVFGRIAHMISGVDSYVVYNAHGWCFLRETDEWKKKLYVFIEKTLCKVTDVIINVSDYEYKSAINRGLPSYKMVKIYNGIDEKKIWGSGKECFPKNKINLLFVGRLDRQKGIDYLLGEYNKCTRSDIHLTVIGDYVVDDGMLTKDTDDVTFLGWVSHDEIGQYYQACDMVVVPSRWEAFGLVAIEALKYGKPVIASDKGALPEIIKNNINGYIFSFGDDSLMRIMSTLSREKIEKLSRRCESCYLEKFTSQLMLKKTVMLYEKLRGC